MGRENRRLAGRARDLEELRFGEHADPHRLLGPHSFAANGTFGVVVRAYHPEAERAWCLLSRGAAAPMKRVGDGLFAKFIPDAGPDLPYRLRFATGGSGLVERGDPYRFRPTVRDADLMTFQRGDNHRLWEVLGARACSWQGEPGTAFAVWAPNARRVSVLGDFCDWDARLMPMRRLGDSGVWELFVPEVGAGATYRFEVRTSQGGLVTRTDPFATAIDPPPAPTARVSPREYHWHDQQWMARRSVQDHERQPIAVYEAHLGSWLRPLGEADAQPRSEVLRNQRAGDEGVVSPPVQPPRYCSYRELAPAMVEHVKQFGFTHIELLPIAEHAFYGSWGYEVTGYYAPTARYGSPDDFRYFVDYCHQHGIGVLLDWVPGHFPKDDFALRRWDGRALYERCVDCREFRTEWGTLGFDYGRAEVKSFLVSNALYWLREFHLDGLRVDAVASILGEGYCGSDLLRPDAVGSEQRRQAVAFLRATTAAVAAQFPGALVIAEDSTATWGVTRPEAEGGLGFSLKWNLGWMHDTLRYFSAPPRERPGLHDALTFAMTYEHTERFVNPLSHDEVVHGKRSLLQKLPGEPQDKLANLRLLLTYQYTRPGKVLLFMGAELGETNEWDHDRVLDWDAAALPSRRQLRTFLTELGRLYHERPALWRRDVDPDGFEWIDCDDRENGVLTFVRRDGNDHVVVVLNLLPRQHDEYRIGVPAPGRYAERLCTDEIRFGGRGSATHPMLQTQDAPRHGRANSLALRLPPLSALVLVPAA